MIKREETVKHTRMQSIREYFPDQNTVLFDIETTGLSWRTSHVYLIGVLFFREGEWRMTQWFLDKPSEEKEMLHAFGNFVVSALASAPGSGFGSILLHYNGDMFDLPYLRHKCEFYGLPDPFGEMESTDIYRKIRPLQKVLGLASLKQKSVEDFLGIQREDRYGGGELIPVYQRFLQTREKDLLNLLFLHNHDDVIGMAEILPILSYPCFFEGGFCAAGVSEQNDFEDGRMRFRMRADHSFPVPVRSEKDGIVLEMGGGDDPTEGVMLVRTWKTEMKHFFPDYKNYFYLPEEDRAIHKDVAIYVDPDHREKAKASTCYQKATGTFLPQFSEQIVPAFYREYKKKPAFFRWEDLERLQEKEGERKEETREKTNKKMKDNAREAAKGENRLMDQYLLELLDYMAGK